MSWLEWFRTSWTWCYTPLSEAVYASHAVAVMVVTCVCMAPLVAYAQAGAAEGAGTGDQDVAGPLTLQGDPGGSGRRAVSIGVLAGRPTVSAIRTNAPPRIDGRLDDTVWQGAARVTEFVQQRPLEGTPATERTEVLIAYDSQNIYFGIHAHYSDPGLIRASRVDRDQTAGDDTVRVYFDPFLDQQRAYVFSVNGYGVQSDAVLNGAEASSGTVGQQIAGGVSGGGRATVVTAVTERDGQRASPLSRLWERIRPRTPPQNHTSGGNRSGAPGDSSWDALFESAGRLVEDGWVAEMAIPFKSLRYPSRQQGEAHRWGLQIERTIDGKNESVVWAPVSRNVMGMLRQMGVLDGMTNLSTSRNLEFLPTLTAIRADTLHTGDGAHDHEHLDSQAQGALNVKYGVTSNLVFDFTYNPDFSQIESDQAQIEVNQRFPVFFPERRPFFLEGQEIYQISAPFPLSLVHTRTVVDPRYGAKLTGKAGNMSLGFMVANDEAPGNVDDHASPAYGQEAKVVLGRLRYDLYSESHLGVVFTDREFLDSYSRVAGVDGAFRLGVNHRLRFTALNADRRDVDGTRHTGPMFDINLQKEGRRLIYNVRHSQLDPEFGTNLGFVRRVDEKRTTASVSYRSWPESWLINWEPRLQYQRNYDYQGVLQDEGVSGRLNFTFTNNTSLFVNVNRDMERFRSIDFWKTRYSIGGNVNTSRRVGVGFSSTTGDQIRFIENPFLGVDRQLNLLVTLRPFSRLRSEIVLNTSRFTDVRTDTRVFDVKILRTRATYQFTDRLLLRNIMEYDTFEKTVGGNLLASYRVNAGTVFFVGYDDHYRQGNQIDERLFPTTAMVRTNRAVFTKLQYLFRY
jgi:hypothetical protein